MSITRIKDGLKAIATEVLEDVRKESEAIILKAEGEAKEILRMGKEEADKAYAATMTDVTREMEDEKRRTESLTEVELRNMLLQTKESLVDVAFEKGVTKINDFTKFESYHDYLLKLIEEAAKKVGAKELDVFVNSVDKAWLKQRKLEDLSKKLGVDLKLASENENCMGGCKIQTTDGKIVYNNTLENRLRQLKPELRLNTAKILFAREALENAG